MPSSPPEKPQLGSRHRFLLRVERFSRGHYKLVFVIGLLALIAGSFFGSRLRLDSDILALMPQGHRQVDAFRETLADFGSIDYLVVLLEADTGDGREELEDFADLFAENLAAREELIEFVEYRFQPDGDFLELFYENALLFLGPEHLPELGRKLSDEAITERIATHRLTLASPTGPLTQELIRNDPLELMPLFVNRLMGNRGALQIDLSSGYYLSEDGQTLIMLIKPVGASQNLEFSQTLLQAVRGIEQETRGELGNEVATRYGGNYAVAVDESTLIRQDVKFNLFFSLFAVSALYWLCYRRFAALLYSSLPLLVGQALTFVLAFFILQQLFGHGLNVASSAFTALLMGLGTDFVIVVYARYIEERRAGKSLAEATELMIGETGLGVFTGAITSAGTFYAMCISQFHGLRHLGFLLGSGILLCAAAILFLLPAMIKWNEGVRRRKVDSVRKLHLQSFFLEHLITFSATHRKLVIALVVLATAGSAYLATTLEFDGSMGALRSNRSPAHQVQQEIGRKFGASLSYMMAVAEAPTAEEAVELTEKIEQRLQPFLEDGLIASYDSVLTYLPPEGSQLEILAALQADQSDTFDAERIERTFLAGLSRSGFREDAFAEFLGRIRKFLEPERPIVLEDLHRQGLSRLLERYVRTDDDRARIVTYIFTGDKRWQRRAPPGLVEAVTAGDAGIVVTGTNIVGQEFRTKFTREARHAVALGLLLVFILLWVDFRSLKLTAIAMSQLICGVIMMLGMMRLLSLLGIADIKLNYVNAFVATMILGVGIDYSIHLVHRFKLNGGLVEPGVLETGKAVVMAALTNIAGFGTLALGNYPALRSFGVVALFGSVTCLLTALTLVPAIMGRVETEK